MTHKFYIIDKDTNHIMSRGFDSKLIAQNASAKYTWLTENPDKYKIDFGGNAGAPEELAEQPDDGDQDDSFGYYIVNHNTYESSAGPYPTMQAAHKDTGRLDWYRKSPNDYSILYGFIDDHHNFEESTPHDHGDE